MAGVRTHTREVEPAQVFQANGDHVHAVPIRREFACRVEQRLLHLVVGREPDFEIRAQLSAPEGDYGF